jgi:restriction system protein
MNRQLKLPLPTVADPNDDVGAALNLLRSALGDEEQRIRAEGSQAMQGGDYDTATSVIDFAKRLLAFQSRVADLEKEWLTLEDLRDKATPAVQQIVSKRFFGRRKSGEITGHMDFWRPLLEVLTEMGGKGRTKDILDRLEERMKGILKPKDYEAHKSDSHQIRWRNTAQWARNYLVNENSLMKKGSPNGVWEISEKGRAWLKRN